MAGERHGRTRGRRRRPGSRAGRASRLTRQRRAGGLAVPGADARWSWRWSRAGRSLRTIWFSFTDANLGDLSAAKFVGLVNFDYLADRPGLVAARSGTRSCSPSSRSSSRPCSGSVIALALNAHFPGRGLLRAAVLIPWAIPTVVSAQMWGWMFNDVFGVINASCSGVGIDRHSRSPGPPTPDTALAAVIVVESGRRRRSWRS